MKYKVKVIGDYAVGDEKGRLIVKPGTLVLDEVEARRLAGRKLVEIVGPVEEPKKEESLAQTRLRETTAGHGRQDAERKQPPAEENDPSADAQETGKNTKRKSTKP